MKLKESEKRFRTIQFSVSTVSMSKTVLFQTIQFSMEYAVSMSKQFYFKQFSLAYVRNLNSKTVLFQVIQFSTSMQLILFDPKIGPHQALPLRAEMNLGAMAMKGYSAFCKASAILKSHNQIV